MSAVTVHARRANKLFDQCGSTARGLIDTHRNPALHGVRCEIVGRSFRRGPPGTDGGATEGSQQIGGRMDLEQRVAELERRTRFAVALLVMLSACGDSKTPVDWRASDNPCSDYYLFTDVVDDLAAEVRSAGLKGEGYARVLEAQAEEMWSEADINRENGLLARASELGDIAHSLECKAWLVRNGR